MDKKRGDSAISIGLIPPGSIFSNAPLIRLFLVELLPSIARLRFTGHRDCKLLILLNLPVYSAGFFRFKI